jgi:hypothetical protein
MSDVPDSRPIAERLGRLEARLLAVADRNARLALRVALWGAEDLALEGDDAALAAEVLAILDERDRLLDELGDLDDEPEPSSGG